GGGATHAGVSTYAPHFAEGGSVDNRSTISNIAHHAGALHLAEGGVATVATAIGGARHIAMIANHAAQRFAQGGAVLQRAVAPVGVMLAVLGGGAAHAGASTYAPHFAEGGSIDNRSTISNI